MKRRKKGKYVRKLEGIEKIYKSIQRYQKKNIKEIYKIFGYIN
jgi:hypothetical protein